MKSKYVKKDKRIKKSKSPKNVKKIVKAKKQARKVIVPTPEEIVTLGFEAQPIEPEQLADVAAEAHEPIPGDPTEAV